MVHGNFFSELLTMPLYVFECRMCKQITEVLQKFGDKWPHCSECDKQMEKKIARTSFALKGNGWAKDNYGLKNTG